MQHLSHHPKTVPSNRVVTTHTKSLIASFVGVVTLVAASGSGALGATATKPANATAAFCRQVKASQGSIAKASGTPTVRLTAIGAEWTKIAATAPADIKADVMVVRTAYVASAKSGIDTPAKAPAVATAGAKISSYFAQNCGTGGIVGAGGAQGDDGEGGPGRGGPGGNSPERIAYRDCLAKNGVTLPAPGQRPNDAPANGAGAAGTKAASGALGAAAKPVAGAKPAGAAVGAGDAGNGAGRRGGGFGLDPNDPAVAKAMKACESLRPTGGFGGGGRGGFGNPAIQACLTKKGITLTPPAGRAGGNGAGGNGAGGNAAVAKPAAGNAAAKPAGGAAGAATGGAGRPTLDAKTQAALDACQKEVGANG
jgi:hypothetical protein